MAELKTKIILRNDSTANWLANSSAVLLKGEVGIEFTENGKVKLKVGDGVKTWAELNYFGGDCESVEAALATLQNDMANINEVLFPSAEGSKTLLSRVEGLEAEVSTVDQRIIDSINDFATKISDDGTINTFKELVDYVSTNGSETAGIIEDITKLQGLVGDVPVAEQIEAASGTLLSEINKTEKKLLAVSETKKYEVTDVPVGTLVDYRDKEIRIMCPADAEFNKQAVGVGGDANTYYMTFKTYAPSDNAVGYIEHVNGQVDSQILTDLKTDEYGRKYQPSWLGLAKYDEATDTWNYYGKSSSVNRYIGWDYQIDWYNADGKIIDTYSVRINLSNEACHNNLEPYYMGKVVKSVKVNGTLLDLVNNEVNIEVPIIKSSEGENKVAIAEDGTMEVNSVNVNKLVQNPDEYLIMNGGSANI